METTIKMNTDKLLMWIAGGLWLLFLAVSGWAYSGLNEQIRDNERQIHSYNERIDALMESLSKAQGDISYIRGVLETENRLRTRE